MCAEITNLPGLMLGDIVAEFMLLAGDASVYSATVMFRLKTTSYKERNDNCFCLDHFS